VARNREVPKMPAVTTVGIDDLRVLYDVHGAELFRFCLRLVGERGLAEEATQETFLKAWKARDRWDVELGSVRTWLYSIARNVSIDLLRARSVRPQVARGPIHERSEQHNNVVDITKTNQGSEQTGSRDAYDELLDSWMLEEGLRRLRDEQRHAIVETYVKGRPYGEVATELGVPDATVRTRVFYGLKALRLALEEMGWNV
jgi:RNA polymerase sigma-70 factor, ECF subfamily